MLDPPNIARAGVDDENASNGCESRMTCGLLDNGYILVILLNLARVAANG